MERLNWSERLVEIPDNGLEKLRVAKADECLAVAKSLGVSSCDKLSCSYVIRPILGDRFEVTGSITATVVQPCIVTLDPVAQKLRDDLAVEFWHDVKIDSLAEEFDEPEREDPEPIVDGTLEIGRVVYELIAANLDPYPRADGAELERDSSEADAAGANHPFAALSELKQDISDN